MSEPVVYAIDVCPATSGPFYSCYCKKSCAPAFQDQFLYTRKGTCEGLKNLSACNAGI